MICFSATAYAASVGEGEVETSPSTTKRKIVMFNQDEHSLNNKNKSKVITKQKKEIEFIVGGHSKDGVAKRSQLEISTLAE